MTEALEQWVMSLAVSAVICMVAIAVTPEGRIKSVLKLCCTVVMTLALLHPLGEINYEDFALNLAKYKEAMIVAENKGAEAADRLSRSIIESEYAAYISDKGAKLGHTNFSVTVMAKWGDDLWYPHEIWIDGNVSAELIRLIEGELGVPSERVYLTNEIRTD